MKVKICGITNVEDAQNAVALGADAIGLIFAEKSPRRVVIEIAQEITMTLPPFVKTVGVFVNQTKDYIEGIVREAKIDLIQLHGDESPEFCLSMSRPVIKAFKVATLDDIQLIGNYAGMVSAALLDTKVDNMDGGTGKQFDWGIALTAKEEFDMPIILAGGINEDNIKKALTLVNPYGIDLASGVEASVGKKDYNKMNRVLSAAKTNG